MAYVYKVKGQKDRRWRYRYKRADGRRGFGIGTTGKRETKEIAERKEAEEAAIRRGWRDAPKASDKPRDALVTMNEYLDWGEAQGGRRGFGWGEKTAQANRSRLRHWIDALGLRILTDLNGCLPQVEKILRKLQKKGRAGKTLQHYAGVLNAFCNWCCEPSRGYLDENPLKGLAPFDTTPVSQRRALTTEEIQKLLECCAPQRRLTYEVAISTGLRAKELRSLKGRHLDMVRGGFHLEARWTKNRRNGFIHLDRDLLRRVAEVAELVGPEGHLLNVTTHPSRELEEDLTAAGIPRFKVGEGKVDFHSLRVAYGTLLAEKGYTAKELKELMRHSTLDMTDRYLRVRPGRMREAAEDLGRTLRGEKTGHYGDTRQAVGAEVVDEKEVEWWRRRESNPRPEKV